MNPFTTVAAPASLYTQENYNLLVHERPSTFAPDGFGGFYGLTENNRPFYQRNITNTIGVRLQKFEIDAAFFYISDKGIITAESDILALSIYLARV